MEDIRDAVIVGGGPAGVASAITLARGGWSVMLLESQPEPSWKIGETLAPEAHQVLRRLGLQGAAERALHLSSPGIRSAWGEPRMIDKDFILSPHGCAWQVDRADFEKVLRQHAAAEGVDVCLGVRFEKASLDDNIWQISLGAESIFAHWIVDATGRRAVVARSLGDSRVPIDQLVSVYALFESPGRLDRDARTYVEAGPDGWWYSALTPDGRRIVAYQTDADLIAANTPRSADWFRASVDQSTHLRALLGRYSYILNEAPKLTSAHSGRLSARHGTGWLAVGDAVQSFDPLSGQGMYHALLTGHLGASDLVKNASLRSGELPHYSSFLDRTWKRFLDSRSAFYGAENRWPAREFWKRRRPIPVAALPIQPPLAEEGFLS